MKTEAPRAVSDLLLTALPQLASRLGDPSIRRAWSSLVGPEIARRTRPGPVVGGCLEVIVDNSPWLCELTLRAGELQERVRARFPGVVSLRFVPGTLAAPDQSGARPAARPATVNAADLQDIDAAAGAIADPDLAAAARRLMLKARRWPVSGDVR